MPFADATRRRRRRLISFFFFVKASSVPGLKTSGCGFAAGGVAERVGVAPTGPEPGLPVRARAHRPDRRALRRTRPRRWLLVRTVHREIGLRGEQKVVDFSSDKLAKSSSSISSSLTAASLPPGAGRLLAPGILDPPWPMIARRRTIRPSAARPAVRSRRRDPPPSRNALGTNTETSKRFVSVEIDDTIFCRANRVSRAVLHSLQSRWFTRWLSPTPRFPWRGCTS